MLRFSPVTISTIWKWKKFGKIREKLEGKSGKLWLARPVQPATNIIFTTLQLAIAPQTYKQEQTIQRREVISK